ncbi:MULTISPECIES: type III secretion protein HrpB2 [Paraburkholderia]|jgi:type III secretion inner rod protein HrpB2|uniref:Type III secretion protein HrpB2 n=1 Tax=Paraburkholderia dipogonis TaxID=1211383 RepID=A0ABW9ASK2_9BURK|nr:type III secretion protein HrpB2 [Paraburkholderia sp. BL9I2N2]TCK87059.1 type III secretion inner rod protein HrpB2 [Paraburkholderia sp. BL9I2N2]
MTVNATTTALQASLEQMSQSAGAAPAAQTTPELADKFQSLMQKGQMSAPATPQQDGTAVASKLVAAQDAELQHTVNDALQLAQQAPTMSMNEMSAGTIRMTLELASTQLDLEAKMGVVDSSKSAIETLMKNQ